MTVADGLLQSASEPPQASAVPASRPPLKQVKLLLPVWGYRYIRQFLEFCLPTMLSPGNLPALVRAFPCEFVLLTSEDDAALLESDPAWQRLCALCAARIQPIDDLITDGNHTATITLAFARAVRETGEDMLDTCFIFLVSDYLFADGALCSPCARIRDGASAVLAGNFQIVAEDAIPLLRRQIDPSQPYLRLPARELVSWSLGLLHPATVANMVNFGLSHNAHTNRLFWRVDDQTLLGRFYLMHMIAIRPEVTNFIVGASCDYSFVPEMCPSNNVVVMTDSDEYLVVEMQPRDHEKHHVRPGNIAIDELATSLSEWTTARHRENVQNTLVYHAADLPAKVPEIAAQADAFIASVNSRLTPTPQPYRNHPYWIGSIASHRVATRQVLGKEDWRFLLGETALGRSDLVRFLWWLRLAVFGTPPRVTIWHPLWPDYYRPQQALQRLAPADGRILVVARQPRAFAPWLVKVKENVQSIEVIRLLELPDQNYRPWMNTFDICFLFLTEEDFDHGHDVVARITPLLKQGGRLLLLALSGRTIKGTYRFRARFAHSASSFFDLRTSIEEMYYVQSSRLRLGIETAIIEAGRASSNKLIFPFAAAVGAGLTLACLVLNILALRTRSTPPRKGFCSSAFIVARANGASPGRLGSNNGVPRSRITEAQRLWRPHGRGDGSARRGPLQGERGIFWPHNPHRLASYLALCRFVAGLLEGRHDVAEYGHLDLMGTRAVHDAVLHLTIYDVNPEIIAEVARGFGAEFRGECRVCEALDGKLPRQHDSIYCLEAIERVPPEGEEAFIKNLRDALTRDAHLLIVGSRSGEAHAGRGEAVLAAAPDATAQGQSPPAGRLAAAGCTRSYRRSGAALKALISHHFETVLPFWMRDDAVRPGLTTAADYVLMVASGKKG